MVGSLGRRSWLAVACVGTWPAKGTAESSRVGIVVEDRASCWKRSHECFSRSQ
ncbi:hypothetical protein AXF42_Ash011589 [Apostasia shenzhenica]|uniref:Uncharacterized protein n=1 Tax=Apostasia shenzhenica TaxID=1088818 RepID=A0A2I0BB17_9ASPA|nr:hypothetical protein AXF42_Ash011589 [Apostasia shenzhenica]